MILQFGMAAANGVAGFCVFLMLANRVFLLMPESRMRTPLTFASCLLLTGGPAAASYFLHWFPWSLFPAGVLIVMLVGEIQRLHIRHRCRGGLPVDSELHKISLMSPVTTTDVMVHRYGVIHAKWEGAPLRIAHITDLHVNSSLPIDYYQRVIDVAEEAKPDLAVFTGDFISRLKDVPRLRQVLRPIGRVATVAVLGNHEYWVGPDPVRVAVRDSQIQLLTNEDVCLDIEGRSVVLTGHDYPWGTGGKRLTTRRRDILRLVLSHTPDNIYRLAEAGADVVFSGHCHAGQVRIPFVGPIIVPSVYGRRFDHGHFVVNGTHLFVASGVGAGIPPVRIYCQPDIFIVDILPMGRTEGGL